jgi:hypothetical protein
MGSSIFYGFQKWCCSELVSFRSYPQEMGVKNLRHHIRKCSQCTGGNGTPDPIRIVEIRELQIVIV